MADTRAEAKAWLDQVIEPIVDPDREIVDPHHHLWERPGMSPYMLDDLWGDTSSGHNVVKTIYMECGSFYDAEAPDHLKSVGETARVAEIAEDSARRASVGHPEIAGIVSGTDLRALDTLDAALEAHEEAGRGRFRGIRDAISCAPEGEPLLIAGRAPQGLAQDQDFRKGIARLGTRGFTYDSWHYHFQCDEFLDLVRACPDTQVIMDHFATPLGVGSFAEQRKEIFTRWKDDMKALSACDNVVAKIGGLAMPDNGFGWMGRAVPPTSDEFVETQQHYYLHMIDCFGPERCMFESNFPVDKLSLSYQVYWNGVKKIVADFSEDEKNAMFSGTAARIYSL